MTSWFCVVDARARRLAPTLSLRSLIFWWVGVFWEVGGLGGVRPLVLKTVRRSRQSPRIAPSMQASRFLSSWFSSVWRLVRGGVLSVVVFLRFPSGGLREFP